jgi:hypothetical protein
VTVIEVRPLALVLPVDYEHALGIRSRRTYDDWLHAVLADRPDTKAAEVFWSRHRYDEIVERAVAEHGVDQVRVQVVLTVGDGGRPLSAAEAEAIRLVNAEVHKRKYRSDFHRRLVRKGAIEQLKQADPGDQAALVTPAWAVEAANRLAAAIAQRIAGTGVQVDGDLANLSDVPAEPGSAGDLTIPVETAAAAVVGAIAAAQRLPGRRS